MPRGRSDRVVGASRDSGRGLRRVIIVLLEADRLQLLTDSDLELLARRRDAEVAITDAADEVEGLLRRPFQRQPERIVGHLALDRVAYDLRRREKAIRGHRGV